MRAYVKPDVCIGCEQCTYTCPEVFKMVNGKSIAMEGSVPPQAEASCKEAAANCPVEAIEISD